MSFQERVRKLAAENSDINHEEGSKWPHNYHISRANAAHFENVCSNLRQQLKREPEDKMEGLNVNTMMWRTFMLVTQQARSSSWKGFFGEFTFNQKSATKNSETIVRCDKESWSKSRKKFKECTLLTDRAVRLSTAKAYAFPVFSIVHGQHH